MNEHPLYRHLERIRTRVLYGGTFRGWLSRRDAMRLLEMFEDRVRLERAGEERYRAAEREADRMRHERDQARRSAKAGA